MKKLLITLSLLIFPVISCQATEYYVSSSGNNGNNGLSPATAFKNCDPIDGANFLSPGDIVNIKSEDVFQGSNADANCFINSFGTQSNPIIIRPYGKIELDTADSNSWTDGSGGDVVTSLETADKLEGTGAVKLTVAAGAGVENLAYRDISATNLSTKTKINFYIKSSVDVPSGNLQFLIDDTVALASPLETLTIPKLNGGIWKKVILTLSTPSALTAVRSFGIKQAVDDKAMVLTIDRIQVGADPVFDGSSDPSTTVSGWGSWVVHNASTNVWVSNVVIPWQVNTVIVDGTSALSSPFLAFQNLSFLNNVPGKFLHAAAGQKMYIRMADNSDPNGHTFKFGHYPNDYTDRGLVRTNDSTSGYIEFYDIHVKGSNWMNFSSTGPYVKFIDCQAEFSARENFYFIQNAAQNTTGAANNVCLRCLANYGNSWGHNSRGGAGQNITIEAANVDIIDSEVKNAWMAGVDFLKYNSQTKPSGRVINSEIHDNSQRSKTTFDIGGFDPEVYVDGASDVKIINNRIYKTSGFSAGNASEGVKVGTEYANTIVVRNIDVVNNLIYGLNGLCIATISLQGGVAVQTPIISNWNIIGNTFVRGSYFNIVGIGNNKIISAANGGLGLNFYNNIVYNPAGATLGNLPTSNIRADYNIYFNQHATGIIWGSSNFAQWKAATGQDSHSLFVNPSFVATSGSNAYRLKNTAAGDATTSAGVDSGIYARLSENYNFISLGSTRKDEVVDVTTAYDIGFHANVNFRTTANTYYIRLDGGTTTQCNGLYDASYDGSGTGENCAWNKFQRATGVSNVSQAIIGGDTVILNTENHMVGYDPADIFSGCYAAGSYDCKPLALPGGPDSAHPTRILGKGYNSGCLGTKAQLWGNERVETVLNLGSEANIDVQCLDITDHSNCIEFGPVDGTQGGDPVKCERDNSPFGAWASRGIDGGENSNNVTLTNVDSHGLAHTGIFAYRVKNWTLDNSKITSNGWVGWDSDGAGDDSYTGTVTLKNTKLEWNGCGEKYPLTTTDLSSSTNRHHCWSQGQGGYGDAIGLGDGDPGNWLIYATIPGACSISFNTSDGVDLLHGNGTGTVTISRCRIEGNAGQAVKTRALTTYLENSFVAGNCGFHKGQTFTSTKRNDGATVAFDTCRANGDTIAFSNIIGGQKFYTFNSTIVSNGNVLLLSDGTGCDANTKYKADNTIFYGGRDFGDDTANNAAGGNTVTDLYYASGSDGNGAGVCGSLAVDIDYSMVYGTASASGDTDCTGGTNNQCGVDPLFTGSFDMGPTTYYTGTNLVGQTTLQATSTAIGASVADETITMSSQGSNDYSNIARQSVWDDGAFEYSVTAPTCGDGLVNGSEQCDGVLLNGQTCVTQGFFSGTLSCSSCSLVTTACTNCGNGTVGSGESCDGTALNSQTCVTQGFLGGTLACNSNCSFNTSQCSNVVTPVCGNSSVEGGEQCDDGNLISNDGCSSTCQTEVINLCGNGVVNSGEQCDDGNNTNGDACSSICLYEPAVCGDGILQNGETCDLGVNNGVTGFSCSSTCTTAVSCGDGTVNQSSEQCDDGNNIAGDGCDIACQIEITVSVGTIKFTNIKLQNIKVGQ